MKKIVGIIAAVAMAASTFAVDFTAGVRMEGNIFTYADGGMTALSVTNNNENYHKPFVLSVSGDRAGATVKINEKTSFDPAITNMNIWFKPFDMVKVEFGSIAEAMNTETMGYWRRINNYDSWGFKATVNVDALTVSVGLVPGKGNNWFENGKVAAPKAAATAKQAAYDAYIKALGLAEGVEPTAAQKADADAAGAAAAKAVMDADESTIAQTVIYAAYNADDIGTFSAMIDLTGNLKNYKIAAGYKNTFGDVAMFADYMFAKGGDNTIDADVKYSADGLTAEAYTKVTLPKGGDTGVQLVSRVSKGFDGLNTYVEFDSSNILADKFDAKITASVSGNVGAMGWEVAPNYTISSKTFAVPFNVAVAF